MTALVSQRVHQLADSLAELKVKVRAAVATELANAVGTAIRDVLVVALLDRLASSSHPSYSSARSGDWRDGYDDRDQWGNPKSHWDDDDNYDHVSTCYERDTKRKEAKSVPAVPAAAAVAVGVSVGRWWMAKQGSVVAAIGMGTLATALGLAGGPVARAALAALAAASDLLTAESTLARLDTP